MNDQATRSIHNDRSGRNNRSAQGKYTKTLEELFTEVDIAESIGIVSSSDKNRLYDGRIEEMINLVRCISRVAPLAGPNRDHGYVNPSIEFTSKARRGELGRLSDDEYNELLEACELLASFWEGEAVLDGFTLARNALVYAVLSDDELCTKALVRTQHIIASSHRVYESAQVDPLK